MSISKQAHTRSTSRRVSVFVIYISLCNILAACSGSEPGVPDSAATDTQTMARPSLSAAELANDGVNTVRFAQAVAAGVVAAPEKAGSSVPAVGAASPGTDTLNPLATIANGVTSSTTAESGSGTQTLGSLPGIDTIPSTKSGSTDSGTADSSGSTGTSEQDNAGTLSAENGSTTGSDNSQSSTQSTTDTAPVTESSSASPSSNTTEQANSTEQPGPTSGNSPAVSEDVDTQFSSHTTPGFVGEVLTDSIRISWQVDPAARGYNVYKQAKYITTVFTNEFIDQEVFDRDYYYEIQAFDYDDTLYYIATGLTVEARTLGRPDPDAPTPNADLLTDYELVFADEFSGDSLDASKWNTAYLWGTDLVINSEEQYYVDILNEPDFGFNPFTFDGDHMTIKSIRTPAELSSKALNQPYLSGVITSYDAFKFTYGYVETRAKVTYGRGYWPAFWLLNAYYVDDKPEIDIMEFIGDDQDVVYHTYHYYDSNGELRSTKSQPTPGVDYTSGFHTYAAEWKPGTVIFFIDGIEVHRITDPKVSRQDMYVIANTALGGWWAGSPDETTPFPGEYTLDYIRVYQKNTPYDDVLLDDGITSVPYADDIPGLAAPNHRPSPEQWPEGYPDGL